MLRNSHGPTPLLALEAVVLDTEATALDVRKARAVQIACVRLNGGAVDESQQFEILVNPGRPVPTSATAIHGITDAMVADAPTFGQIAERLERFIGPVVVIGHGLAYDLAVLRREYELAGRAWPRWRALDVIDLARIAAPSLADHGLDRLCEWLEVDILGRHTALGDAAATAELFLRLVPLLRSRNIRTLAEAEAGVRELVEREFLLKGRLPMDGEKTRETLLRIDSFPYRYRVSDVMTAPPVFADRNATVMQAARLMVDKGVSSVFVRCTSSATGIVTERDILRAVAVHGEASASLTIEALTTAPLQTIQEDSFVYRAIGRLQRLGFRHLGVEDGEGRLVGAVTTRSLLRGRTTPAVILGDEIESAATPAELASAWAKLVHVARNMAADEVDPRTLSSIVSSEICDMTRRAAQLAERRLLDEGHGPPPKLRARDFPTMHNYLRLTLCNMHIELTKRIDRPALIRSLREA